MFSHMDRLQRDFLFFFYQLKLFVFFQISFVTLKSHGQIVNFYIYSSLRKANMYEQQHCFLCSSFLHIKRVTLLHDSKALWTQETQSLRGVYAGGKVTLLFMLPFRWPFSDLQNILLIAEVPLALNKPLGRNKWETKMKSETGYTPRTYNRHKGEAMMTDKQRKLVVAMS